MLHKRFHSCHVVIRAARVERAAMISAALCNPLPSKQSVITDGLIETLGTHSVRETVHTHQSAQEQIGAFVCAVYACMQMSVYCMIACMCVHATAWMCMNTHSHAMHGFKQVYVCRDHMGPPTQVPTQPDLCVLLSLSMSTRSTTHSPQCTQVRLGESNCTLPRTHTPNPTTQQWSGAAADSLSTTFLLCSELSGGKLEGW